MEFKYNLFKDIQMVSETFNEWSEYREKITNKIFQELKNENGSLIIFGAGECNDLDLKKFEERFNKITLVDFNLKSLDKAIENYELRDSKKINIKNCDFLGVTGEVYEKYEKMLIDKQPIKKIIKFLRDEANKIFKSEISFKIQKHEVGICLGVHSQLTIIFEGILAHYSDYYNQNELKKVHQEIEYMNTKVVKRLNDYILDNITSKAFLGFDIMEISEIRKNINLIPLIIDYSLEGKFEKLNNEIVNNYLVTGASQGNQDIIERISKKKINMICYNTIIWPFNKQKYYLLYLYTVSNKVLK